MSDWCSVNVPNGSKIFKSHSFTFMHGGNTYVLEIDEYSDGTFSGHGEHSTDKSSVIESVSGSSTKECLEKLIGRIESRD